MVSVTAAILVTLVSWCSAQAAPRSPCPAVFRYEQVGGEQGRWYGVISLRANAVISSLWLNIVLDSRAQIQRSSTGNAAVSENLEFKIVHIKKTSYPAYAKEIRFYVNYNSNLVIPRLAEIRLNDREICNIKTTTGRSTQREEGTFYWIKLIGSEETKPATSSLSRPVNALNPLSVSPTAYEHDTNSWVTYISKPQPAPSSTLPVMPASLPNAYGNVDQSWTGRASNTELKTKHINMGIFPTPGTAIQFYVHYDPYLRVSTVTDIRVNGKEICDVETIQPAANTPSLRRGVATIARSTTPTSKPSSWANYLGSKITQLVTGQPTGQMPRQNSQTQRISPLANSASNADSWTSYISQQQQPPSSWSGAPTTGINYAGNTFNQQQSNGNDWTTYISGSQPLPQGTPLTPSPPLPPTQQPSYRVDQSYEGDNTDFAIEDVEMRIYPAPATDIWFHVQYNPNLGIPKAVEIKLNGKDICKAAVAQTDASQIDARYGGEDSASDY